MKHIPNILSALRLAMVGVFLHFFAKCAYAACMITYAAAFLTDILDGYLARRNHWISDLGKILDPLADKLMLLAALSCFYFQGWIPLYLVLAVAAKELLMFAGALVMLKKNIVVVSDWMGKAASGLFNVCVLLTLLKCFPGFEFIGEFNVFLFLLSLGMAISALLHYACTQMLPSR